MLTELIIYIVSGFGLLFFFIITAHCIFNAFDYSSRIKYFFTGIYLGLCSLLFNYFYFSIDSLAIFDFKFMLLIMLAISFNNSVLLIFAPIYLAGVYYSGFSPLFAVCLILVAFIIGLLKIQKKFSSLLLFITIIPIAFSEIPALHYLSDYTSKLTLTIAVGASVFLLIIAGSFFLMLNKNFMNAVFIRAYIKAFLGRLNTIYTFKINRKKTKVIMSQKCAEDLEFNAVQMTYADFCQKLSESTDNKIVTINKKIEEALFVTVGTGRKRYIEYSCYPRFFFGYKGIIYDVTERIPKYELLSKASIKDYVTGLPAYPVLKESILQIARKSDEIILFASIEVTLDMTNNSIYDIEFEHLCYRFLASLLTEKFSYANFFSIKSGELFMAYRVENSKAALDTVSQLKKVFSCIYDVGQKSVLFNASIGAYYTESMRINSLLEVTEALKKIEFCKHMVSSQQHSNIYLFSQNQYDDYLGTRLRIKHLPQIIENGDAELVFQPIVNFKTGDIIFYEALLRVNNDYYNSTAKFIEDCINEGYDINLDKMVISKLYNLVKDGRIDFNFSFNILGNTPITNEIQEMYSILFSKGKTLYIEITEHMYHDIEILSLKAKQIKICGAKIIADDYGTGYTNNSILTAVDFDVVKLPRELVSQIGTKKSTEIMVKGIANFCNEFNILCVAEGIENKDNIQKLLDLSINYGQGYFLQKPITLDNQNISKAGEPG